MKYIYEMIFDNNLYDMSSKKGKKIAQKWIWFKYIANKTFANILKLDM